MRRRGHGSSCWHGLKSGLRPLNRRCYLPLLCSTGTLMVFGVVSVALIWKRVYNRDLTLKQQMKPFWLIAVMTLASVGASD